VGSLKTVINRVLATLEIARPHNMVAAGACVYSGYRLSGGAGIALAVWAAALTALVAGLGNLINDYFDAEIDRVNKPQRPIPSGRLTRRYVRRVYAAGTAIATMLIAVLLPLGLFVFMTVWEGLLFLYAARAKRGFLIGNFLVAAVCASAFAVGASVAGALSSVTFPFCFAFFFVLAREFIKSAEDVEGDRLAGASTLAVRGGARKSAEWGALLILACVLAAPVPAVAGAFGRLYGTLVMLLVVPGMLTAALLVLARPERAIFNRASWILKIEMLIGIVVMGLSRG
jgi:geranylgeranylglycerol-phosphate geranylgeranyltransferase